MALPHAHAELNGSNTTLVGLSKLSKVAHGDIRHVVGVRLAALKFEAAIVSRQQPNISPRGRWILKYKRLRWCKPNLPKWASSQTTICDLPILCNCVQHDRRVYSAGTMCSEFC